MDEHEFQLYESIEKAKQITALHGNIRIAYSGGADSDVVIDFMNRYIFPTRSVMYDTGVEFQATIDHVHEMRARYDIDIVKAVVPVPVGNKKYGYPFLTKRVSDMLGRLQRHGFEFAKHGNLGFDKLNEMYPKCKAALRWWCDEWGEGSRFSIVSMPLLKEFLIKNDGLPFKVSPKCCDGAKKKPARKYASANSVDLFILGMRKAEGGVRSTIYKGCYQKETAGHNKYAQYFPLFHWNNEMVSWYCEKHEVEHSRAYTAYGLSRTGCAACPFGSSFDQELDVLREYEPKKYKGISKIFEPSHEYLRKYRDFKRDAKNYQMELFATRQMRRHAV